MALGVVSYASPLSIIFGDAPLWVLGLWGMIGATFDDILQWVKGDHPFTLALFGLIGAPIASYTASLIGAVSYPKGIVIAMITMGLIWAALLPVSLDSEDTFKKSLHFAKEPSLPCVISIKAFDGITIDSV